MSALALTPSPILDADIGVIGSSFIEISSERDKVNMKDYLNLEITAIKMPLWVRDQIIVSEPNFYNLKSN